MTEFKPGERVNYQYLHHIDRSTTHITKHATFIRPVKQRIQKWGSFEKAVIQVDGNKGPSTVPVKRLYYPAEPGTISKQMPGLTKSLDQRFSGV